MWARQPIAAARSLARERVLTTSASNSDSRHTQSVERYASPPGFPHAGPGEPASRRAVPAWLVSTDLVVERAALGLPLVPHSTEDRARMETDTKANEEGNQRQNDASGAIALLP